MKIVHLCLGAFFPDGYSYQENMLPKFHKIAGYNVEVIASLQTFDENGKVSFYAEPKRYINENNILVTRLAYRKPCLIYKKFRRFQGLFQALERAKPDILFIHNVQFLDIDCVVKYLKKYPDIIVFCDNHADLVNSASNWISKKIMHGFIWKRCANLIEPYTKKFYGVLPARVSFLTDVYGLPSEKCHLLVMGADDEMVELASSSDVRDKVRKGYGVTENELLLMTGGKIDQNKQQVITLMQAFNSLSIPNAKLVIFGSVIPELKEVFKNQLSNKVIYAGWKQSNDIYNEFSGADLILFPGLHSVLWEQAVAMGKPCIFKRIDGFTHIDIGGNCVFFDNDTIDEYKHKIQFAIRNIDNLKSKAIREGKDTFSYKNIAARAIK